MTDSTISPFTGIGGQTNVVSTSTQALSEKLQKKTDLTRENNSDSADVPNVRQEVNRRLEASNINSFLSQAASALNEVVDLREKQQELAEKAAEELNSEARAELDTEFQAIESEIGRIRDEGEYNGSALLDGTNVFNVSSIQDSISEVTAKPSATSIVGDLSALSLDTIANAEIAESTIDELLVSTRSLRSQVETAESESARDLKKLLSQEKAQRANNPNQINNEEDADKLAKSISEEIAIKAKSDKVLSSESDASDNNGIKSLIANSLDPDRVDALLRD